ncbi:DUF262 domain-containing protein [Desulfococcaceae bacterium HSG8]|nr:DUF262 domain-containing protein [Desulfococcaceae bacterium HSG8]
MDKKIRYSDSNEIEEELAADGRPAGVESDTEERERQEPFDPEQISIDSKVVSMDTLTRRLLQGSIRLAPAFQRKEIWDLERKSQLIESLMLKILIPMFYVAADERGKWDVVDGLQRLTAVKEFILGNEYMKTREESLRGKGFRLKGLEFWGHKYDGLIFSELPNILINRILETEFRFTIINPGTPEEVKRNVFKRINTGGMPLTSQEIRHALYQGESTRLLEKLAQSDEFRKTTAGSVKDSRMAARELILRFLAFSVRSYADYPKNSDMDTFLSDTMRLINIMPELPERELHEIFTNYRIPAIRFTNIKTLEKRFSDGMNRASELFGTHAFRKSIGIYRRSPINKALFEVWGNLLADLEDNSFETLLNHKEDFSEEYNSLLTRQNFGNLISRYSLKHSSVKSRYETLDKIINKYT